MEQLSFVVDESAEARALRDEGIQRAHDAAKEEWKREALQAIAWWAWERAEFTTDVVWQLLDERGVDPPREPRAMAGVLATARRLQYVEPTGRYVNSTLKRGHARHVQVYRSLRFNKIPGQLTLA